MLTDTAVRRPDLLSVADAVSREKRIDREEIVGALESAIRQAGQLRYGVEKDVRCKIDRRTGDVTLSRWTEIVDASALPVDEPLNMARQIDIAIARRMDPDAKLGGFIVDALPPIDFGRIAAQAAKQVIVQKVRESERKRVYVDYKDRIGEIVNGTVKHTEYGNCVIDLGSAEGMLHKRDMIARESYRSGDRVRAYIEDVVEDSRGPQVKLSRTCPGFLAKLFAQEVPEIYDGIIEIKAVARDPGSRAKMAVISKDTSIDPVGACVGMRGSRVQAVVQELGGERVDIIHWSPDLATFLVNAMAPGEVARLIIDEDENRVEAVVAEDQLSLAIGRRGQNVRLAGMLTRMQITLTTEKEDREKREGEMASRMKLFSEALDVDDMMARLLATEGFVTLEDLAYAEIAEIEEIPGLKEFAGDIQARAAAAIERKEDDYAAEAKNLGLTQEVADIAGLPGSMLLALARRKIFVRDDLADLDSGELISIVGEAVDETLAGDIIMAARAHWFEEA